MTDLTLTPAVERDPDGTLRVSSEQIADGSGVQHKNVLELIMTNRGDFEAFGDLAFETRDRPGVPGPALRVALLNEQQATLLMTYQRNTDQVRRFKVALVKAFFEMAQHTTLALTGPALLAAALIEAEATLAAQQQQIAALEPPARSWNALADSAGDYDMRDAAQILCRDPFINIGRNRLAKYLREIGWLDHRGIPYQRYVDQHLLDSKPQTRVSHRTGERIACDPQVRITLKGLGKLHHLLGGTEPLAIDTPTNTDPLEAIA